MECSAAKNNSHHKYKHDLRVSSEPVKSTSNTALHPENAVKCDNKSVYTGVDN